MLSNIGFITISNCQTLLFSTEKKNFFWLLSHAKLFIVFCVNGIFKWLGYCLLFIVLLDPWKKLFGFWDLVYPVTEKGTHDSQLRELLVDWTIDKVRHVRMHRAVIECEQCLNLVFFLLVVRDEHFYCRKNSLGVMESRFSYLFLQLRSVLTFRIWGLICSTEQYRPLISVMPLKTDGSFYWESLGKSWKLQRSSVWVTAYKD